VNVRSRKNYSEPIIGFLPYNEQFGSISQLVLKDDLLIEELLFVFRVVTERRH
jgi:hypothetical protein